GGGQGRRDGRPEGSLRRGQGQRLRHQDPAQGRAPAQAGQGQGAGGGGAARPLPVGHRRALRRTPPDRKAQARRAALNALKRARRTAERAGVDLSEWEGEFLGSVEERVKTYGRAFGDPEKGAPGEALSLMQAV